MSRLFIVLLASVFGSCGWLGSTCENVTASEVSTGDYSATVFTRGCGTASRDYVYLNLRKASTKLDFESPTQMIVSLKSKTAIRWNGSTLKMNCDECLESPLNLLNEKIKAKYPDITLEYGQ